MKSEELFALGLGLVSPWKVASVNFEEKNGAKELHINIDFERGTRWKNDKGDEVTTYDTEEKTWRHMNFFEHKCFLHCRVPRIPMSDGKYRMVSVPWARPGSGFSLLFEAFAMKLIESEMPISAVSKRMHETSPRIWRVFHHWIKKARQNIDLSNVRHIGVDETSSRRGHRYITHFVDLDTRQIIFATEGKDTETFSRFVAELESRGGKRENIKIVSMDMSPAFVGGYLKYFGQAAIVFDKFHLTQMLNEALDATRKNEQNDKKLLRKQRFTLLHRKCHLSEKRKKDLEILLLTYPSLGEAYKFKEGFFDAYLCPTPQECIKYLDDWCKAVMQSSLLYMRNFVKTLRAHWFGITTNFTHKGVSNGILEGINSKIQLAKRRARGFGNIDNFIDMAYFVSGKLTMPYPYNSL